MHPTVQFSGMPMPAQVLGSEAEPNALGPSQLRWRGIADPRVQSRFESLLEDAGCGLVTVQVAQVCSGPPTLGADESYVLEVGQDGIELRAARTWGALHGLTTLAQLAASGQLHATRWHIEDAPRFGWRGVMLDPARHFLPVGCVLQVLEGMAMLKLNVLHLHLTDDQGFRLPSTHFPRLPSSEHYSGDDLRRIVAAAADLGIRVVPELDMPGHVTSWLAAYPEWGCEPAVATDRFGVHEACLNPADESVYAAIETLLTELCELFPDEYVHIGGDEVHPRWWSEDAPIQQFMAQQSLADTAQLQAYFNRRVCQMLRSLGRQPIGWDEALHEDMPDMLIQNWRGASTRDRALARGLDCLVSSGYYLDLFYPADMHYAFDPQAPQDTLLALEDEQRQDMRMAHVAKGIAWTDQWRQGLVRNVPLTGRVIGGEACLWSELVDERSLFVRLFSRLPAVAERLWSARQVRDVDDMYRRLQRCLALPPFELHERIAHDLQRVGLSAAQTELVQLLEPVKWYARLLGMEALQARISGREMPQARPYRVHTPLERAVDFIAPESLAARGLEDLPDAALAQLAAHWQQAETAGPWPDDLRGAVAAMTRVGTSVSGWLKGTLSDEACCQALQALYGPHGEYMLAMVPPLLERVGRGA